MLTPRRREEEICDIMRRVGLYKHMLLLCNSDEEAIDIGRHKCARPCFDLMNFTHVHATPV